MKYLFFTFVTITVLLGCNQTTKTNVKQEKGAMSQMMEIPATMKDPTKTGKYGRLVLDMDEHDFGDIVEGEIVTQLFRFTNNGNGPLLILDCQSSCGCTVPKWPKEPIPIGGVGDLEIQFNSRDKSGEIAKSIIIITNGKPNKDGIVIRANVISAN